MKISGKINLLFFFYIKPDRKIRALQWGLVRLSVQGDFGVPARKLGRWTIFLGSLKWATKT